MAIFPVNSFASLRDAINNAQNGDTIKFTVDLIVLEAALPAITKNLTFTSDGRNTTISGGNNLRVFRVTSGNVTFTNLTIANGTARGTAGTPGNPGGRGGNGLGGGLLIDGGSVTLINTNFENNRAIGGAGGNSTTGTGGNGGDGLGGAIYVNNGSLRISNTSFSNNSAIAGSRGTGGTSPGQPGKSQAGAIFINTGNVLAEGNPRFSGNFATNGPNTFGPGKYDVVNPPQVQSINRANPDPTAQATVEFTVQFNQDVAGVDASDFVISKTGNITGEGLIAVVPVSNSAYTVRVNAGSGNGSLRLDLKDNDSIRNSSTVPLGGSGLENGSFPGQAYTINRTPPTAEIRRKGNAAEETAANIVAYTVFFSEPVNGIDTSAQGGFKNFQLLTNGGISGAQVVSVKPRLTDASSNTAYDVEVNTGSGNGEIVLRLIDDDSITSRVRGVPLNGSVTGPNYSILKTPPTVASVERLGNSPTGNASANFRVTFTQDVAGVTKDDFVAAASGGIRGASVVSVTPVDAQTYTVVLNTGRGDGSLGLNVADNDSIRNRLNVPLGGTGNGNGNFVGPAYSVLKSAPLVSAINLASPNPTASGIVDFTVTFNQSVTGVTRDDFRPVGAGISGFSIREFSGSGNTYKVIVNTGTGSGSLGLNLVDNDSIRNNVGAPLGGSGAGNGNFAGQTYTIRKVPPRVAAINRVESSPTNAATVNFTVSFNENVSRVDPSDFNLVTQGVTGAGITSVTRINDSFYSVAVSTGRGEGIVGLNLVDNDSIINGFGLPLGGAGANNGSFVGEIYSIDRTSPSADLIDVVPDPRQDKVDAVTVRFSEAVKGFDLSDVQLTRSGRLVSLNNATLTSADGITWTLGNLRKLTNQRGDYELLVVATGSGITDAAGNPLISNVGDRWTNLVTVEACDPGITRRGTKGANRLQGTEDSDVLIGRAGNDVLTGLDCRDRLDGGAGADRLNGGLGADLLIGGAGADRFIYSGSDQASAFENSLVTSPDQIVKFRFSQSDKFQLDFDENLNSKDRPKGFFNAGRVKGRTLEQATKNAYGDKDQSSDKSQKLGGNQAVLFSWRRGTYLSVNDRNQSFSANQDLVVNVTGIQLKAGDASSGSLNVANYFI
jgi:hypothetical protein